ncbi:MAG: hypothetical protein RSB82_04515 [Victivallaceae bacterium]
MRCYSVPLETQIYAVVSIVSMKMEGRRIPDHQAIVLNGSSLSLVSYVPS